MNKQVEPRDGVFSPSDEALQRRRQAEGHQPSKTPRAGELPPPADADEDDEFEDEQPGSITS